MTRVNTRDRIMEAALKLFLELGYQKTSIARIESEAGLAPRAGAFYRHFDSKQTLLMEVARTYVAETPEEFGLDKLADFGDTRSELIAVALKYEEAMNRQQPFSRLIDEVRLLDFGADLQHELNTEMMVGLEAWIRGKPAAKGLSKKQRSALVISVIGGWLFYLSMLRQDLAVEKLRDSLLDEWATRWASVLDAA
ncbi:MAG TPA: TetR/AcrR family transcriptional regulator [Pseudomonadales bacterium]